MSGGGWGVEGERFGVQGLGVILGFTAETFWSRVQGQFMVLT